MRSKLASAPVRWTMGQPLLPEHFEAQEQALRDELQVQLSLEGRPRFGVARIRWDASQLDAGVVRLQDLTLLLPSGRLLDIPGNCEPVSFDLESVGSSHVMLQLARLDVLPDGSRPDREDGPITRRMEAAKLVGTPSAAPGAELFALGRFTKDVEGLWSLDPAFIPPCTSLKETPFFTPLLDRFHVWLERFHQSLRSDLRENFLAGHRVLSAQQSMRTLFELQGWLADLTQDLDPHPYVLFDAIRRFYIEVCIYRELRPTSAELPYDHLDLAGCFGRLTGALEPLLSAQTTQVSQANYVGFEREDGMIMARLPREAGRARQVFVLVQKSVAGEPVDLTRYKFASPKRLPVVHQRSLRGIPMAEMDNVPFHHDFSSDVAFFGLELDDEWDYAVGERAIALYERPALKGLRLFVYWR